MLLKNEYNIITAPLQLLNGWTFSISFRRWVFRPCSSFGVLGGSLVIQTNDIRLSKCLDVPLPDRISKRVHVLVLNNGYQQNKNPTFLGYQELYKSVLLGLFRHIKRKKIPDLYRIQILWVSCFQPLFSSTFL